MRQKICKVCEYCNRTFRGDKTRKFCSPKCAREFLADSRKNIATKRKICGYCGKNFVGRGRIFCSQKCFVLSRIGSRRPFKSLGVWSSKEIEILKNNFSNMGCDKIISSNLLPNKTKKQIQNKATWLHLTLSPEVRHTIISKASSEHMTKNNPSKRPEAHEYLSRNARNRPDVLEKLFEGHRKLQKDKPSKLEKSFYAMLDQLEISYQDHFFIKPKFIVDSLVGKNLIIEIDGDWWHGHPRFEPLLDRQKKQQTRDKARNAYLRACGYIVIRIWESDLSLDLVESILKEYHILI